MASKAFKEISIEPDEERIAILWKGQGGYWAVDPDSVSDLEPLNHKRTRRRR